MGRFVDADKYFEVIRDDLEIRGESFRRVVDHLHEMETADVVSRGLFEQYKWERDVAISQLNALGLSLGQKIDGVYITKEEYDRLLECVDKRYKYGKNLFVCTQFR